VTLIDFMLQGNIT